MQPKTRVIVRLNAPSAGARRRFPWFPVLMVVLFGGAAAAIFSWEHAMARSIYPGVRIAGINVGGESLDDARTLLAPMQHAALTRTIVVKAGSKQWTVTPQQLGLQLDIEERLRTAYALGRETDPLNRYLTQADLALHGRSLALAGNYDGARLRDFVTRIALQTYQPAQAAVVSLQQARAVLSTQARDGSRLDTTSATSMLAALLSDPAQSTVTLPLQTIPAPVSEAEGQREVAALSAILTARLHLHAGTRQWLFGAEAIASEISLTTVIHNGGTASYQHGIDTRALAHYVDGLATTIDQQVRPAAVVLHGAAIQVVPARTGYHLDTTAASQAISQAILQGGEQDLTLPVSSVQPTTPTDAAARAAQQAAELIRRPVAITFGVRSWLLTPSQLGSLLTFTPRRDPLNGPQLDPHVDARRLPAVLSDATAGVDAPARDARFQVTGTHVQLIPAVQGRRIDFAALAQAIETRGRTLRLPIPTQSYEPALSTAKAQAMGINDLFLEHTTTFPGSSTNRLTNIHAAVLHLDGQLIAPGEIFSFNKRIGDITTAAGYVQGINIIDNQDVPGIGGGVCQVAVTLFQSAVYAGMKIIERTPHANIVSYYNPVGMDATIYVSANGPDVKFQNNTGHWVLISFQEDLANDRLTARFFGTDPHFKVTVRGPFSTTHPNGDVDAVFYRTVRDSTGKVILDAHFNSHYVPASAG